MTAGDSGSVRQRVTVVNERGLHARAAAQFVKMAEQYDADIVVSKNGVEVSGLSIMGLLLLAAAKGGEIEIEARGRDAAAAVTGLAGLVAAGFNEG